MKYSLFLQILCISLINANYLFLQINNNFVYPLKYIGCDSFNAGGKQILPTKFITYNGETQSLLFVPEHNSTIIDIRCLHEILSGDYSNNFQMYITFNTQTNSANYWIDYGIFDSTLTIINPNHISVNLQNMDSTAVRQLYIEFYNNFQNLTYQSCYTTAQIQLLQIKRTLEKGDSQHFIFRLRRYENGIIRGTCRYGLNFSHYVDLSFYYDLQSHKNEYYVTTNTNASTMYKIIESSYVIMMVG
jgi:hypothetical protein